jgi:hydroxyethylthiazole kinase-like sugar kinase family protein
VLSNEVSSEPLPSSQTTWQSALTISWIGQTMASGCWIASVFAYGVSSTGDALQLAAASAWMIANFAALREPTA